MPFYLVALVLRDRGEKVYDSGLGYRVEGALHIDLGKIEPFGMGTHCFLERLKTLVYVPYRKERRTKFAFIQCLGLVVSKTCRSYRQHFETLPFQVSTLHALV